MIMAKSCHAEQSHTLINVYRERCSVQRVNTEFFFTRPPFYETSLWFFFLLVLSETKTYSFHKTSSHRWITLSYSEIHWCAALPHKSNFFLISPQGCRDETSALSPLPPFFLYFFQFCLKRFGTFKKLHHMFTRVDRTLSLKLTFILCWPISWTW